MNRSRLMAVVQRELLEIRKNRLLLFTIFLPPLLLTFLPLALLAGMGSMGTGNMRPEDIARLQAASPELARYAPSEVIQLLALQQFLLLYLMMPLFIPMTVAAFSIIGEKESRSLEPVLATPIRTVELLLGKSIAAVVPAMLATWLAYGVFFFGAQFVMTARVYAGLLNPMWIVAIVILAPLCALLSVSLGVLISSRVNDTRVAQQIGGMIVIPLILLGMGQLAGIILLSALTFVIGSLIIALLDAAVLVLATRMFQREMILTRWK